MYKLRELERKDMPIVNLWRRDSELIHFLGSPFRYINSDVDDKFFDSYMSSRDNTIRCAIVSDNSDVIIGLVTLANINHFNQSAVLHIMIGEKNNQDKGIGTFALTTMLDHAFYNMNLHRIELDVLAYNERAIHLYEKVGFKREGTRRKAVYKNGDFVDMHFYAILKDEYKGRQL